MKVLMNIRSFVENGYAGNHFMAETDTGVAAGGLGRTIGDAVIAFNHTNVMFPLVTVKQAVMGSSHVNFGDWTKLAASNVTAATQATTTTAVDQEATSIPVASVTNLSTGDILVGNTDFPLGFYKLTVYEMETNDDLNPDNAKAVLYNGIVNMYGQTATTNNFEEVQYNEYTTNDSENESVYLTN